MVFNGCGFSRFVWGGVTPKKVPVLCYHRFGVEVADSMTIKNAAFAEQMEWLKTHGYTVISRYGGAVYAG